jgi:hypothetical protein
MAAEREIFDRIQRLVDEENTLRARRIRGELAGGDEHERLSAVEVELDQCWDLLRQRRALRDAGRGPDEAAVRPPGEVEGYLG